MDFKKYPYQDFNAFNLDYILEKVRLAEEALASLDRNIQNVVVEKLTEWLNDGTLADLITDEVIAQIGENTDNITALQGDVADIKADIDGTKAVIPGRNIVFFGDSWTKGTGATPQETNRFSTKLSAMLEMTEYNFAVGASGFTRPLLILDAINGASMTAEEITNTKYVIITGGVNDLRHDDETSAPALASAIITAARTASAKFPNAVIIMAIFNTVRNGWTDGNKFWMSYCIEKLMEDNVERVAVLDMRYITYNRNVYVSDNLHPDNNGHSIIASYMAASILGGNLDVSFYITGSFNWDSGITVGGAHMFYRNGLINCTPGQVTLNNAISSLTQIGTVDSSIQPIFNVYSPIVFGNAIVGVMIITNGGNIYINPTQEISQFYVTPFTYEC